MELTEKYRPTTLSEVIGQKEYTEPLSNIAQKIRTGNGDGDCPNVALIGEAGTGKSTIARAFIHDAFGSAWRTNLLMLNASDERGIDVVRDKIITFAQRGVVGELECGELVPFSLIYMEEFDSVTPDAQGALRTPIEENSKRCRFFISLNNVGKVIPPILDRFACRDMRFRPLSQIDSMALAIKIINGEQIRIEQDALAVLTNPTHTRGSGRTIAVALGWLKNLNRTVMANDVIRYFSSKVYEIPPTLIEQTMVLNDSGKTPLQMLAIVDKLFYDEGVSCLEILMKISKSVEGLANVAAERKQKAYLKIAEALVIVERVESRVEVLKLLVRVI